jgi:hypothetical protein
MNDASQKSDCDTKELLQTIVAHLEHIDRRDRIRLWGGLLRSIFSLIPAVIVLWTLWYVSENTDALLRKIAHVAVEVTSGSTSTVQDTTTHFWDSLWEKK